MTGTVDSAAVRLPEAVEEILGYAVSALSHEQLAMQICAAVSTTALRGKWLACINPHSYVVAKSEPRFADALRAADWLVPDGAGIVLASRILRGRIRRRVTGPEVFAHVSTAMNRRGPFSVLFLGATDQTLASIRERYAHDFPAATAIATYSPPFRSSFDAQDVEHIREVINRHRPDLLWVGLSAPKQELLLASLIGGINFGFAAAIGAEFDFYAGTVKRAPRFFREYAMEWLPRLFQQPRRLWNRMLVSAPLFLVDVARARLGRRAPPATPPPPASP